MLPMVTVPETIRTGMAAYRQVFCREAGLEHVGLYVTGLLRSPHKTWQGMYATQVWQDGSRPSRRAMHATVRKRVGKNRRRIPGYGESRVRN
jgi:hypothetical protein